MSKMSNLDLVLDEMIAAGHKMIDAAEELKKMFSDTAADTSAAPAKETSKKEEPASKPAEEVAAPKEKTYSFQEVRGIMATLAGQGKKVEAKALLTKFGANRLSEVKEEDFPALVTEAEAITNG